MVESDPMAPAPSKEIEQRNCLMQPIILSRPAWIDAIRTEIEKLPNDPSGTMSWVYWAVHNPWSRAGRFVDSWRILDICQETDLVSSLKIFLGPNIILYDTCITPDPTLQEVGSSEWRQDSMFCPVSGERGAVARFLLHGTAKFQSVSNSSAAHAAPINEVALQAGDIVIHDARMPYRLKPTLASTEQIEFVVRYFPSTSNFLRDPGSDKHRKLTEAAPLRNYAKVPLWLIAGRDLADNDFVTGFDTQVARWINRPPKGS